MKVLAIDFGQRRLGTAIADTDDGVAFPRAIIVHDAEALTRLAGLIADEKVDRVLVGLPLTLGGDLSDIAAKAAAFADLLEDFLLAQSITVPVDFADERWSTKSGHQAARHLGLSQKQSRGRLDSAAATVFLQAWLDHHNQN